MGVHDAQLQGGGGIHAVPWPRHLQYGAVLRVGDRDGPAGESAGGVRDEPFPHAVFLQDPAVFDVHDDVPPDGDGDSELHHVAAVQFIEHVRGADPAGHGERLFDFPAEGLLRFAAAGAV